MNQLFFNVIAISAIVFGLFFLFQNKLRTSVTWHATITPLASVIGSGFLVSAPLLMLTVGVWALPVMISIVTIAYAIGSSLRFNIQYVEPILGKNNSGYIGKLEWVSRPILGLAYIISVAFYLKILSAFVLQGIGVASPLLEKIFTTLLLMIIGVAGKYRGLSMLELFEIYSVNTKLAIIFAVVLSHFAFNMDLLMQGQWALKIYPHESFWIAFRKILGLLIIIQGFETSRYLGQAYNAQTRIQTMRYAQWITGFIYVTFVGFTLVVFNNIHVINETTTIDLCRIIAPVLPPLLIVAAIMSQFSASVADTVGSGGLLSEATDKKISVENSYLVITAIAMILTWTTNIYEIISIGSKAFAAYYATQLMITIVALKGQRNKSVLLYLFYLSLLLLMVLVIVIGIPAE